MNTSNSLCIFLATITLAAALEWYDYPPRQNVYDRQFLETILKIEIFEVEPIKFNEDEIVLLSTEIDNYSEDKQIVLDKFFRWLLVLQCNYALIMHDMLSILEVSHETTTGLGNIKYKLKQMLSIFFEAKSFVHNYFWLTHIASEAVDSCGKQPQIKNESLNYISVKNKDKFKKLCVECKEKKLVPYELKSDAIRKKWSTNSFVLNENVANAIVTKHMLLFIQWRYILLYMGEKLDPICMPIGTVSWEETKKMMSHSLDEQQKDLCRWSLNPYKTVEWQEALVLVSEATVMYRVLVHLMSYAFVLGQYLEMPKDKQPLCEEKMNQFWLLLKEPLKLAVEIFDIEDRVIWALRNYLVNDKKMVIEDLENMIKAIENRLKKRLTKLRVPQVDSVLKQLEYIKINENTDMETEEVTQNTKELHAYILGVQLEMDSVSLSFVRFFLKGQNNDIEENAISTEAINAE